MPNSVRSKPIKSRDSIAPEKLPRAQLLMARYTIGGEWQMLEWAACIFSLNNISGHSEARGVEKLYRP